MNVKYATGPRCSAHVDERTSLPRPDCPFRPLCIGYSPTTSPAISTQVRDNTVDEVYPTGAIDTEYLFLMESIGRDEAQNGRNAVGFTGKFFNRLLEKSTTIHRAEQTVANVVRCWPIQWEPCNVCRGRGTCEGTDCLNGAVPSRDKYGRYIGSKASPAQVRECASRYGEELISRFEGTTIVWLGKAALEFLVNRVATVKEFRGTIFEPGEYSSCGQCSGSGSVPGGTVKCKNCQGRGTIKCGECGWGKKHRKSCTKKEFAECGECGSTGTIPKPDKVCKPCGGSGKLLTDPTNKHICERLKPGQLLFGTYHPAWLRKNPTGWDLVLRDFSRLGGLRNELQAMDVSNYVDDHNAEGFRSDLAAATLICIDLETGGLDPDTSAITDFCATDQVQRGQALSIDDPLVKELLG